MSVKPSADLAAVADAIVGAFGGFAPHASETHVSESGAHQVKVLSFADQPEAGAVSYATLGLCAAPLRVPGREGGPRLGVELLGVCHALFPEFKYALSTAAFGVLGGGAMFPGQIVTDAFAMYYPGMAMEHLLFIDPISWAGRPQPIELPGRAYVWLQAVPIAESERRFAGEQGPEALIDALSRADANVTDPRRSPVL
jgi:hypothetical protein